MNIRATCLALLIVGIPIKAQPTPQYETYSAKNFRQLTPLEKSALNQYIHDMVLAGGADHAWQTSGSIATTINKWKIADSWLNQGIDPNWKYGPDQISLLHAAIKYEKLNL